ncbi:MAG: thiamine-binding protein [Segetibacter sp.]
MHNYLVNASIQILPIAEDRHPYEWVDEAILVIQKSGIKYMVGPFATVVEGSYVEVMAVVNAINEHLFLKGCNEWIASVQLNMRSNSDITGEEKVSKFSLK